MSAVQLAKGFPRGMCNGRLFGFYPASMYNLSELEEICLKDGFVLPGLALCICTLTVMKAHPIRSSFAKRTSKVILQTSANQSQLGCTSLRVLSSGTR